MDKCATLSWTQGGKGQEEGEMELRGGRNSLAGICGCHPRVQEPLEGTKCVTPKALCGWDIPDALAWFASATFSAADHFGVSMVL